MNENKAEIPITTDSQYKYLSFPDKKVEDDVDEKTLKVIDLSMRWLGQFHQVVANYPSNPLNPNTSKQIISQRAEQLSSDYSNKILFIAQQVSSLVSSSKNPDDEFIDGCEKEYLRYCQSLANPDSPETKEVEKIQPELQIQIDSAFMARQILERLNSSVEHDLNNRITVLARVALIARALKKDGPISDKLKADIKYIDSRFSQLSTFIREDTPQLLKDPFKTEPVNIQDLKEAFATVYGIELRYVPNIHFEVEKPGSDIQSLDLKSSGPQARRLMQNTAFNASKIARSRPDRQLNIKVDFCALTKGKYSIKPEILKKLDPSQRYMLVVIEDDGIGFQDPKFLEFGYIPGNSGFQKSGQPGLTGTGRAMPDIQQAIEIMGGFVDLQNVESGGARQIFGFPLS